MGAAFDELVAGSCEWRNSRGGASKSSRPAKSRAIRSAIFSALGMWCVMVTMVACVLSRISRITSSMISVMIGSSPVLGSSKSRISGSCAIARAKPTRRRMPPESSAGYLSSTPSSFTMSRHSRTRSRMAFPGLPNRRSGNATFPNTVIESKSAPS